MPGRILVVDDVATNRIILKVKLTNACYDVLQAGGGREALEIARRERPELILLDMAMPDMDGLDVCRALRSDPATADIPVIVVTSHTEMDLKLAALKAGAAEFLSKPFDEMELLARIRSLLRARGVAAELALRDGTSQALGFAEPASSFTPAGRICLVGAGHKGMQPLKQQLTDLTSDRIELQSREQVLSGEEQMDLFVVPADLDWPGGGLLLLSELRSRPATRHAGIVIVTEPGSRQSATMALDLGASDIVSMPIHADELVLRLRAMMQQKRQADRLRSKVRDGLQMAVTDPLTGLFNRRYAMSHLSRIREQAETAERAFAIMLIDLDHFKRVNDTHGHATGDHVLKTVAETLSANLRNVDLISRIGGEEFLAVLPNISAAAAVNAAERLRGAVASQRFRVPAVDGAPKPAPLEQTISIGLVVCQPDPRGRERTSSLLDRADKALYAAKAEGRNRVNTHQTNRAAA